MQAGFHAIGDDAVQRGRPGAARGGRAGSARTATVRLAGCAHRVEHAEMADAEAIAAFAETGTVASMQPLFDAAWGGPDGMYARRLGAGRAAAMNPFAAMAVGRGRAGLRVRRAGHPGRAVGRGAGRRAPPHRRAAGCRRGPRSPRTPGAVTGPRGAPTGGSAPSASARPRTWRSSAAGELVRPAADPTVARWSTDPRSRVPLLPDLTPGVELPTTLATLVGGRIAHDTGLFG